MELSDMLPNELPEEGLGEDIAFDKVAEMVRDLSANLGAADALAHMDPPTPEIAAKLVGLNAAHNQNLLHPDLSPFATHAEKHVLDWLLPHFGMRVGHMCAGSTVANLAALWCAREHGARHVVASRDAHISVPKAASILGMSYEAIPVDSRGRLNQQHASNLSGAALVLTAGTTGRGVIDELGWIKEARTQGAKWVHVDAAWAGPLCLTRYAERLYGVEDADSVAVSAHKWLYQPKDSAIVMFSAPEAQEKISFGGAYLAVPNVGVQGSRGAAGIALLGTLLAWGRSGLASRIEESIALSEALADRLEHDPRATISQRPETGVLNWRPTDNARTDQVIEQLADTASRNLINGKPWVRHVATNPHANLEVIWSKIDKSLR